jgi:hypothetical protein
MPRYDRLRKAGMLTVEEMAALLGITTPRPNLGCQLQGRCAPRGISVTCAGNHTQFSGVMVNSCCAVFALQVPEPLLTTASYARSG